MAQVTNPESGLRNHRVEFVRESNLGQRLENPEFGKYSTSISEISWTSDATLEPRRGIGTADPIEHLRGPETHEVELVYDMVKFPVDESGDPNDASYDAIPRDSDNKVANSHTYVNRESKSRVSAESTLSGETARPTHTYTVARGGLVDEGSIIGDPSDSQPVTVELSYIFQKARSFQIDQPTSDEGPASLCVKSTVSDDAGIDVTIEDESASATETLTLGGSSGSDATTLQATTGSFSSVDAFYLSGETQGDVTLHINSGTESTPQEGDVISRIYGIETYRGIEGDLGVPALGDSGSREDISGQSVINFLGDTITWNDEPFPHEIQSMTITAENNVEEVERSQSFAMGVFGANRTLTAEATMYGETATHTLLVDHLTNATQDLTWEMKEGEITLENTSLTEPGERAVESEEAIMTTDNTYTATGMTITHQSNL